MWRDYPWYIETSYDHDDRSVTYDVVENYVCVLCKERKRVVLQHGRGCGLSFNEARDLVTSIAAEFASHLESKAIVEDMIHDDMLVDRERLKIWEKLNERSGKQIAAAISQEQGEAVIADGQGSITSKNDRVAESDKSAQKSAGRVSLRAGSVIRE